MADLPKETIFNFKKKRLSPWKSSRTIVIVFIIILLIIGGFLFWNYKKNENREEYSATPTEWSQKEDYKIIESPEGKIVKNEKAGLKFEVPEGWEVQRSEEIPGEMPTGEYWIELLGPNVEFKDNFISKGCGIWLGVRYQKTQYNYLSLLIEDIEENPDDYQGEFVKKEIAEVNNRKALKTILTPKNQGEEIFGKIIQVEIPFEENGVLSMETHLLTRYREKCIKEFEQFLDTITIE